MSGNTEIPLEQFDLAEDDNLTLILGSRCIDGVVIIADTKFTSTGTIGIQYQYGDKITGELNGVLTAFAGDAGAFNMFAMKIRDMSALLGEKELKKHFDNRSSLVVFLMNYPPLSTK
jgi:20S proteasome alpha/beta subunit